ncbi:MAG: hypothetical protein IT349_14355 [Candidatus Eisenbacteria bacterium]|nr:hypothetical protein [Candidatus Eisenbacteria bacterium]
MGSTVRDVGRALGLGGGLLLLALVGPGVAWTEVAVAAGEAVARRDPPPASAHDTSAQDASARDALDEALALSGLTRTDLGWEARGWWERYPQQIPHLLRHFDDLLAEPLAIAPFTRAMGAVLTTTLAPDAVASSAPPGALYRAVHDLGVNKRYGATRAYSANLTAPPTPLAEALLACWGAGNRVTQTATFGGAPEAVRGKVEIDSLCAPLPPAVSTILGKLVLDLLDARGWAELAFRAVPLETRSRIAERIDIGDEMTGGAEYEPAMDDAARSWDEASLWYAGLKTVEALDLARRALADTLPDVGARQMLAELHLSIPTPVGLVMIDGTDGHDLDLTDQGAFLVVDLGGNDRYSGPLGASTETRSIGAALDLSGDDHYSAREVALGAGLTGIGVLLEAGGDDQYRSHLLGQGAGLFGLGALLDLAGTDRYDHQVGGQGAAFFGIGMLLDLSGADQYVTWGDAQGYGGAGGIGVLGDREGNDTYLSVVDPKITGRPSGHSAGKISASGAQGCGMGRRGDGSDGHSWAGGLGALLDASGDDRYTIGNWGQGCGYWFGTGLFWDGGGNDESRATGWANASGAHFCIGAKIDEGGDDLHETSQNWGPAYGHDFTVSLFLDASGNDRYLCGSEGIGHSINRSVALCLEGGGDDVYTFTTADKHPGKITYDPRFLARGGSSVYWTETTSLGLFVDLGGRDSYPTSFHDDFTRTEDPASDTARARNFGIFVDRDGGRFDLDRPHGGKRGRD